MEQNVTNNSLSAKIELWKSFKNNIDGIESGYIGIFTLFTAIGIVLYIGLTKGDFSILYFFVPFVCLMCLFFFWFYSKKITVIHGYLAEIEESINNDIGDNHFIFYSKLVNEYFHTKQIVNVLSLFVFVIPFGIIPGICFFKMWTMSFTNVPFYLYHFIIILYIAIFCLFAFFFWRDIALNGEFRKIVKKFSACCKIKTKF